MQLFFSFDNVVEQLISLLSLKQFGINTLDVIVLAIIAFYCYEGYALGFALATLDLSSFVISFLLGLVFFSDAGHLLIQLFSLPQGFANAIGFFVVAFVSEVILAFILRRVVRLVREHLKRRSLPSFLTNFNHPLGILPGLASAYILLSFILTIIIALPTSAALKQLVTTSRFGDALVSHTINIQGRLNSVFGGAVQDTLNVMTVKPESDQTIKLHFTVASPTVDEQAEAEMVDLVNKERISRGLKPLHVNAALVVLARKYATKMLQRGYFSHYSPEGLSPFDRMNQAGITYIHAGENLALAPSTSLAHQGLMNSPGHRANILSPDYTTIGVGVMDAGIYGKMFVQEFTD